MIRRTLSPRGWTVHEAANGREGLEAMKQRRPDVVLLDLMMPEMDGFEFLDHVAMDATLGRVPVIVLTAKMLSNAERGRLTQSVLQVIEKSDFGREELVAKIGRLVPSDARKIGAAASEG
jgi:CheY-like chemotaxis protein